MATGTRSKVKDMKVSSSYCSTATVSTKSRAKNSISKDVKSSATSGSVATDSSSLRRSTRETFGNKMRTSSASSQNPERSEEQTLSSVLEKKFTVVEKKTPSPLRRSQRIEKHGTPGSSGSKKSNSSSTPQHKKKKMDGESGTAAVAATKERRMNKKLDIDSPDLVKGKKRMNARTYRALLKRTRVSGADSSHPKEDNASQENTYHSGSYDPNKVQEGEDECNGVKEEDVGGKHSDDSSKEAMEGSSSCSKELVEFNLTYDRERNSVRLSRKQTYEERSPVSKCSGSSMLSLQTGVTSKVNSEGREIDGESQRLDAHELDREELGTSEFTASSSEERSSDVDIVPGNGGNCVGFKSENMDTDLVSNVSVNLLGGDFNNREASRADAISVLPSGSACNNEERCTRCSKLRRVHNVLQAQDLCACNAQRRHDFPISISEEVCEPVAPLEHACEGEIAAMSSQESEAKKLQVQEVREQASVSEKENCLVASPSPEHVSIPMEVDRGRHDVSDSIQIAEGHLSSTQPKESSVAVRTDSNPNACVVCKHSGSLLCCDATGCKRSYHLSCLEPPLRDVPPGVWLCCICVKKKLVSGVHSVSQGIESVLDVKEGTQNGKQYLVKYKGLAHVHNLWIPERQLLHEAPMLVAKFNRRHQKEKVTRWKQEWTQPHRLLQKRLLMPQSLADTYFGRLVDDFSHCRHEWLVKWKGLGYEYATWEFENSAFLCSNEAKILIKNYENRREEAKKESDPLRAEKSLQVKKNPLHKLTKLPDGCPAGLDNDHLISVNRLREFWHKSQNAVFIDDQERIIKSILFISALDSHICRPFLVISTIASLSLWETDFIHYAPAINVVVYNGNKDVRKLIRTLEFYEEGGCVMFQVLLSHPDAIIEDFEAVDCISWEAVIVDECQNSRMSKHLEQFKYLSTDFHLLLLSSHLKDNLAEYLNLLSFLDLGGKEHVVNSLKLGSADITGSLAILKERFARYLAYERKTDSSKFLEYWVPVRLSNVQLEQYCATLVSNLIALRSCSKVDHVGVLREILISTRKCCDHPYLVDQLLQSSLTGGLTPDKLLDVGVKASGKLLLFEKILHEMKNRGLRVLVLFQQSIGGAGRNSIGDILDDFLRQRFGADSYERVESGLIMSKKLAALNMFNEKARGRFVFLLEKRACLPSIKLSSVDAVIIYDSDWNPLNDLRALQRISIESQFEQIKVFRLYSSCTVEEKVLILAKEDTILESIQSISPSTSHLLLSWGASCLFSELDKFHEHDYPSNHSEVSNDKLLLNDTVLDFLNDVMLEIIKQLPKNAEASNTGNCSILVKAQQSGTSYSRNIRLVGEKEGISTLDRDPPSFWSNLLETRCPKWRYISEPSQRNRKKVQYVEEFTKASEVVNDEVKRKRRKVTSNTVDPNSPQTWLQDKAKGTKACRDALVPDRQPVSCVASGPESNSAHKAPAIPINMPNGPGVDAIRAGALKNTTHDRHGSSVSDDIARLRKSQMVESDGREKLLVAQRSLHLLLKPELSKLCDVLKLPEDVKDMADRFLEYIMNNHLVSREPETILQAFMMSLCWRAASFLKHKVDHKECLALAKKYLNFACNEEQADSIYSKLRILKKIFSQTSESRNEFESCSLDNQSSSSLSVVDAQEQMYGRVSESAVPKLQELGELRDSSVPADRLSTVKVQAVALEAHVGTTEGRSINMQSEVLCLAQVQDSETREIRESPNDGIASEQLSLVQEGASVFGTEAKIRKSSNGSMPSEQQSVVEEQAYGHLTEAFCPTDIVTTVQLSLVQEQDPVHEAQVETRMSPHGNMSSELGSLKDELLKKRIDLIHKICLRREDELLQKQQLEVSDFNVQREENKMKLKSAHDLDMDLIRSIHIDHAIRNEKIKLLSQGFLKKMARFDQHMKHQRKALAVMQVEARNKERQIKEKWLKEVKAGALAESFDSLPLQETGFRFEEFKEFSKRLEACDFSEKAGSAYTAASDQICIGMCTKGLGELTRATVKHLEIPPMIPRVRVEDVPLKMEAPDSLSNGMSQVESLNRNGESAEIAGSGLPGGAEYIPMDTETPTSQYDLISSAGSGLDVMPIVSSAEKTGMNSPECEDNSCHRCLVSFPQQNQAENPSLPHALTNFGCENTASSNQVPSFSGHGSPSLSDAAASDAVGSQQGFSSPQQDAVSALQSVYVTTTQEEATTHNTSTLNSNLPLDISSVDNCQASMPAPLGMEEQPSLPGALCSYQQNEVSIQQLILPSAVQFESRQGSTSTSRSIEDHCSEGTHSTGEIGVPEQDQIVTESVQAEQSGQLSAQSIPGALCSSEQIDVSMQQPVSAMTVQDENHKGSIPASLGREEHLSVGTHSTQQMRVQQTEESMQQPISAVAVQVRNLEGSTPASLESEENCNESAQQIVMPVQEPIVAAAMQAEQSNQVGSQSVVHPLLPSANILPGRTCFAEELCIQGTHSSTQEAELSIQRQLMAAVSQAELCNQPGWQSAVQSLVPHANVLSQRPHSEEEPTNQCTEYPTQQNEVSTEQPIVAADIQHERTNQLLLGSVVHSVPPGACRPSERARSEQEPCIHSAHCDSQPNEILMERTFVAAAIQAEEPRQLVSQSIAQPLPPHNNIVPARTHTEDIRNTNSQAEPGSRLLQIFRMLPLVPIQGLHPDPLQNELLRICKQEELCTKLFEDKKVQLKFECDQEIEKVRRKFDALRQEAETIFSQDKKIFEATKSKIRMNLVLADEFRARFIENKGVASASFQGHRSSNSTPQFHQAFQTPPALRPSSASPPIVATSPATLPPVSATAAALASATATSSRVRAPVPPVASVPPGPMVRDTPIFASNHIRSHFSPTLPTRANPQAGSKPRAPAPHLHRFRPPTSLSASNPLVQSGQMNQQQPLPNVSSATSWSTPIVPTSWAHSSVAPISGTCQPALPALLQVCRGMPSPPIEPHLDIGDSNIGIDPPNLSQVMEVDPSSDRWLLSNLPLTGNDLGSNLVAARPNAAADVVCLSDDD